MRHARATQRLRTGKAGVLLELKEAGFPVPDLVCSPDDLDETIKRLGTPLAVRSAASAEDGREVSFAGQFQTFLNLNSPEEVNDAVRRCRESVGAPSVLEYCRRHGIDADSIQMEVIVQRMIRPELAGVAFSVNPATGAEEVVIEATEGLADKLLAGEEDALPSEHPLVTKYAPDIRRLARSVQRYYGAPQDIEFAVEHGRLYLLQARPVTQIHFSPEVGEWTNADFRDGGVSSSVCTPLMWSLYDLIWEDALKDFLRDLRLLREEFQAGRMFFGRPYWNLGAVKQCLARLPGFVEREFDTDLSVRINYDGDGLCTPVTPGTLLRALPSFLALPRIYKRQERTARRFLFGEFEALEEKYESLPGDLTAGFANLVNDAYHATESAYFRTIFTSSIAKLDFRSSFPDADYGSLMTGLPELRHFAPTRALREMAQRGETDVGPLLKEFRHHSRRELDIRTPRWDEDREFVEQLLQQYAAAPQGQGERDPRMVYEQARRQYESQLSAWKRRTFQKKLERLRTFVWLREEMRDLSSRIYYLIRRYVLAISEERGLGDDVFFMTWRQLIDDDRSAISRNREIYESYRNFQAPNEIGARFTPDDQQEKGAGDRELAGIGASHGRVRGPACVAHTVKDAADAEYGSILICPFTDPGWTPVLDRFAAVVTETGGMLSHAAVICREYGIPAVLGVSGATQVIDNRQLLLVDGSRGCVTLYKEAPL